MSTGIRKPGDAVTIQTNKALLVINCQNDSFYKDDDFYVTKNPEYVDHVRDLIPYFRRIGDVIWINTEMPTKTLGSVAAKGGKDESPQGADAKVKTPSAAAGQTSKSGESTTSATTAGASGDDPGEVAKKGPAQTYDPSSRLKRLISGGPDDIKAEKRNFNMRTLDGDDGEIFQETIAKTEKQGAFFIPGTKGAEVEETLKPLAEGDDLTVVKHFYSAFDQTSLLTALRKQLITEVYLCGGLTNASIYSTAADAVQHGLDVTVIENCLGFRSAEKHEEAMRQMADIMGVTQVMSEEVIEECGGRVTIESKMPAVRLDDLTLGMAKGGDDAQGTVSPTPVSPVKSHFSLL